MKLLKYEEYSLRTSEIYNELSSDLKKLIPNAKVEHIGSSAIVGSLSKGDLDVLVAVDSNDFKEALEKIKSINFFEKQNTLRTDDLCMLITNKYHYDVAIQLIVNGSGFENFIQFRDVLRGNLPLVFEYNEIKKQSFNLSSHEYRENKSKFIKKVLNKV